MRYFEIIGPSAVGKSTLYRHLKELMKMERVERKWLTYDEAILEAAKTKKTGGAINNLLKLYYRQNLLNFKKRSVAGILVNSRVDFRNSSSYTNLIASHLKGVYASMDMSPELKSYIINWYSTIIKKCLLLNVLDIKMPVYFDEGPIQNNFGIEYLTNSKADELPMLAVFLESDEKSILANIYNREKTEKRRSSVHEGLSESQLLEKIGESIIICGQKKNKLIELGVPVYTITSTSFKDDAEMKALLTFLNNNCKVNELLP